MNKQIGVEIGKRECVVRRRSRNEKKQKQKKKKILEKARIEERREAGKQTQEKS